MTRPCKDCGNEFTQYNKAQTRCPKCQLLRTKPKDKKQHKKPRDLSEKAYISVVRNTKIKNVSEKQLRINREYKKILVKIDNERARVCEGCGRGDVVLSHSHIISRQDCHNYGKPELIYDKNNIRLHCMSFAGHKGCHDTWETRDIKKMSKVRDFEQNMEYIKGQVPEVYNKLINRYSAWT